MLASSLNNDFFIGIENNLTVLNDFDLSFNYYEGTIHLAYDVYGIRTDILL